MKIAVLTRTETGDDGTFGTLEIEGKEFRTGELPDKDNKAEISCIPTGTYRCVWNMSNRFKRMMYQVLDVPGRTGIRFHSANFCGDTSCGKEAELNGCIALGKSVGKMKGQKAVLNSRLAMDEFEMMLDGMEFQLIVEWDRHAP